MPTKKRRKLSNLETTVLGLAWLRGPCTIYAIMKELSLSSSSFHKSRAGTAYSVANRLIEFGMLQVVDDPEGAVRITKSGLEMLQAWIEPPVPMADIAHSADMLRLRFFFLGVVDQESRLAFIESSIEGLGTFLKRCEELIQENEDIGDYFGALATVSCILETRARIEWLRMVREWVINPIPEHGRWTEQIFARLGIDPVQK